MARRSHNSWHQAIGFVRESAAPEHQLLVAKGRRGLMRFWDCCGAEAEDAPGCVLGFHVSFDADENARRGWENATRPS